MSGGTTTGGILNEGLRFEALGPREQRAFSRRGGRTVLLDRGTWLWKFQGRGPDAVVSERNGARRVSPWWFRVEAGMPEERGLAELHARATASGHELVDLVRARAALDASWGNGCESLHFVRLLDPAYAIAGPAAHQPMDSSNPALDNVVWIGGEIQLFVPNLTPERVEHREVPVD